MIGLPDGVFRRPATAFRGWRAPAPGHDAVRVRPGVGAGGASGPAASTRPAAGAPARAGVGMRMTQKA